MRAVNLIPQDSKRGGGPRSGTSLSFGPGYALVGALSVALVLVLITVLTGNTISERRAHLATLEAQVAQESAAAAGLAPYRQFVATAQTRAETVREIAVSRFDWDKALSQLSKVVPANTSFQSLLATVAPGAGSSGSTGTDVRGDIDAPAFEITGCTQSQDDVASLMTRLRLISDVTRVTLGATQKSTTASGGTAPATGSARGCPANTPTFNLVVFFTPIPSAGPDGVTALVTSPAGDVPGTTAKTATVDTSTTTTAAP